MALLFDRITKYVDIWQDDLERVYKEALGYTPLLIKVDGIKEAKEEVDSPAVPEVFRRAINLTYYGDKLLSAAVLFLYIYTIRPIIFDNWTWEEERARLKPQVPAALPSGEEIYSGLKKICPAAVEVIFANLGCSLSEIKALQASFQNNEEVVFLDCLGRLNKDDLLLLDYASTRLQLGMWLVRALFESPQALEQFVCYTNQGVFLQDLRNLMPQKLFQDIIAGPETAGLHASDKNNGSSEQQALDDAQQIVNRYTVIISAVVNVYKGIESIAFPFEKEYYTAFLEIPSVKSIVSEMTSSDNSPQQTAGEDEPETAFDPNAQLRKIWFELPFDYDNLKNYYQDTTIKSRNTISFEEIESIYSFLVAQKKVKNDNDMLLLFAYRISGRKISGVKTGEVIEWQDVKEDPHLPYIIYSLVKDTQIPKKTSCFFVAQGKLSLNPSDLRTSYRSFMNGKKYEKNPFKKAFEKCFKDTFGEELIYSDVR